MVSRKPLPSAKHDQESATFPIHSTSPTSSRTEQASPPPPVNERIPLYSMHENDATANPWEDSSKTSEIGGSWRRTDAANETISPATERVDASSDLLEQIKSELHELTPQSSWERDSEPSSDDAPTKPDLNVAPSYAPPAPPSSNKVSPPSKETNPYRTRSAEGVPRIPISKEEDSSNIWAEIAQDQKPSTSPPVPVTSFHQLGFEDKPGWDSVQAAKADATLNSESPLIDFDHAEDYKKELESTPFGPPEGLEDIEQGRGGKGKGKALFIPSEGNEEVFPPPAHPPPTKTASKFSDRKITVPEEVANKQRSETYQIKHVRWADSNSHEIRTSPILIQNKNGPCPLMALVNALTLSTPSHLNTALIETLRVREQISLGLLLDAVFDELMSGRRGDAVQELPDVSELYAFLITLHTGMNVNPRFIPAKRFEQSLMDGSFQEAPLTIEDYRKPGSFEDTKEMMLYGTFSVPLIHGWLPPKSHPAFQSIERSAVTYEDAQNLMFREEELEDKLRSSGLNPSEQQLLEDITGIKYFLSSTATQLTAHGLETMNEVLQPGSIAILFRNDHFSTLYKQPRTGQLLLLVTDAGYSTHEEIVWESLADVSGESSEFFSGDFRPVGGNPTQAQAFDQSGSGGSDWQTVARRKGQNHGLGSAEESNPSSSNHHNQTSSPIGRDHEQEDADLALAMQLQEEEEENSRRTAAERRRLDEEQASSQYLAQGTNNSTDSNPSPFIQGSGPSRQQPSQTIQPLLPPRRNTAASNSRPPVHREQSISNNDDAPPSYEAASKAEPYLGPDPSQTSLASSASRVSTSSRSPQAPPAINTGGRPRGQSAYSTNSAGYTISPTISRRRSGAPTPNDPGIGVTRRTNPGGQERDKDCIVM